MWRSARGGASSLGIEASDGVADDTVVDIGNALRLKKDALQITQDTRSGS